MLKLAAIVALAFLASGCATVINDAAEPLKLDTMTEDGTLVSGADCDLTNDHGTVRIRSGETARIERSGDDPDVVCRHADNPDARATVVSRVSGSVFGNIVLGGGIGAVVDHAKGTAYTYPRWIQLIFGQTLLFDQANATEGAPVPPGKAKLPAQ